MPKQNNKGIAAQLELYGHGPHLELQKKLARLEPVLVHSNSLFNGGRTFGVEANHPFSMQELCGFVEEFGMIGLYFVDHEVLPSYEAAAQSAGHSFQVWNLLESDGETASICADVASQRSWPSHWRESFLDETSNASTVREYQDLAQAQGVSGPPGYMLRGGRYQTVSLLAYDGNGAAAVTAYSADRHAQTSSYSKHFFAGMVGIAPEYRRLGLGTLALSRVIEESYMRYEVTNIHAAVKADNLPSNGMCNRCGLHYRGRHLAVILNPGAFEGAFTR